MATTTPPGQEKKWIDLSDMAICTKCKNKAICKNVDLINKTKTDMINMLTTNNNEALELGLKCIFYIEETIIK